MSCILGRCNDRDVNFDICSILARRQGGSSSYFGFGIIFVKYRKSRKSWTRVILKCEKGEHFYFKQILYEASLFPQWAFRSHRSIYNTRMAYGHQQVPFRHPFRHGLRCHWASLFAKWPPSPRKADWLWCLFLSTACWLWNIRIIQMKYASLLGSNQQPNCQKKWQEGKKQHSTCSRWITGKICPAPHHYTWRRFFFVCRNDGCLAIFANICEELLILVGLLWRSVMKSLGDLYCMIEQWVGSFQKWYLNSTAELIIKKLKFI